MTYKLIENFAWYGDRRVPFTLLANSDPDTATIPLEVESAADLDLEAIARELNRTVFNRGPRFADETGAAKAWELELRETTKEKAEEITVFMKSIQSKDPEKVYRAQLYIAGRGISLRYELQD